MVVAGLLLAPSLALADGKVLPGSQHSTPVFLDEPSADVYVLGQSDEGYNYRVHVEVKGIGGKNDRLRLEWKKGGKVLATTKCDIDIDGDYAAGNCTERNTKIKQVGDITADLIYSDDKEDKDYLVRTFKFSVVHYKGQWETWGIISDDTLGNAWFYHAHNGEGEESHSGSYRRPVLYITFANGNTPPNPQLRCSVDGTKLGDDIGLDAQGGSDTSSHDVDFQPKGGKRLTYHWTRAALLMDMYWGPKDTLKYTKPADGKSLQDHPGKWQCDLRSEGHVLRTLAFTVDKDGMIQNDEFNSGKNAVPVVSKEVMVDMRIGKDAGQFDERINPAAIKKSLQWGLAWPDHAKVKDIQKSLPAKSGMPDAPSN